MTYMIYCHMDDVLVAPARHFAVTPYIIISPTLSFPWCWAGPHCLISPLSSRLLHLS